jgi:hypothetical protein
VFPDSTPKARLPDRAKFSLRPTLFSRDPTPPETSGKAKRPSCDDRSLWTRRSPRSSRSPRTRLPLPVSFAGMLPERANRVNSMHFNDLHDLEFSPHDAEPGKKYSPSNHFFTIHLFTAERAERAENGFHG